jgi:hypothetical protein
MSKYAKNTEHNPISKKQPVLQTNLETEISITTGKVNKESSAIIIEETMGKIRLFFSKNTQENCLKMLSGMLSQIQELINQQNYQKGTIDSDK